jgi:DNA-binding NtrC family response regulator
MSVKPFILIIDDERNIAAVLGHLLRSAGFRAETASGALEGVGVARKDRPDLILMEILAVKRRTLAMEYLWSGTNLDKIPQSIHIFFWAGYSSH